MQPQAANPILNLVPLVLIFAIFYFMLIRPQRKKEKEQQRMLKNLSKNDEVVTSSGIHGTIVGLKEKTVTLRIDDNVKIELERNCVAFIKKPQGMAAA